MTEIHYQERVRGPFPAFGDREDAGRHIVDYMAPTRTVNAMVLPLPRGGIPVAQPLARVLDAPLEPVIVRKLPIPSSPEAGFGAVTIDGSRVLNDALLVNYPLSDDEIDRITEEVMEEVRRRAREYVGHDRPPDVQGKHVYMVDDGLASGFSMIAAATMVQSLHPESMTLCVPVAPERSIHAVEHYFDRIYCLFMQQRGSFAVASFYEDFHDLTDHEVLDILQQERARISIDSQG